MIWFGALVAVWALDTVWPMAVATLLVSPTNTLPLEIYGELISAVLQPNLYALGVITTMRIQREVYDRNGDPVTIRGTTRCSATSRPRLVSGRTTRCGRFAT